MLVYLEGRSHILPKIVCSLDINKDVAKAIVYKKQRQKHYSYCSRRAEGKAIEIESSNGKQVCSLSNNVRSYPRGEALLHDRLLLALWG